MNEYTFEVKDYGKSMYGGWYANYNSKEKIHRDSRKLIAELEQEH